MEHSMQGNKNPMAYDKNPKVIPFNDNIIIDEIHSLCNLTSKDGCGWKFYLQNPTPVLFQGPLRI